MVDVSLVSLTVVSLILHVSFSGYVFSLTREGMATKLSNFKDRVITTNTVKVIENVVSGLDCIVSCLEELRCESVFYRKMFRRCQLHDVLFLSPQDGETENGTEYYSLSTGSCPPGYTDVRTLGICYRHLTTRSLYDDSVADCASKGEHLLVIDSQEKLDHFVKQVSASSDAIKHSYFIDGNDAAVEGEWRYHDNRSMTFFKWCPSYPHNSKADHDYLVASTRGCNGLWKDKPKSVSRLYFCEKDIHA